MPLSLAENIFSPITMKQAVKAAIQNIRAVLVKHFHQYNVTLPYVITVVIALIVVLVGINVFIELTSTLKSEALADYDSLITDSVFSYRTPWLTNYLTFMTHLGDAKGYLVVFSLLAVISYFGFKRWKYTVQIIVVLVLALLSNLALKRFIDRARPDIEQLVVAKSLSYPSGHAMVAMAFYGFVIYLIYKFRLHIAIKIGIILLLTLVILSIGISRIYLGVHYPSDVIGGYIAGFIWVIFCILIFDLIELFRRDPKT